MNVTVENLAPCKKLVRVELEPEQVDKSFEKVTKEFQRQANLPGFRPGKAPLALVIRHFDKDIETRVKNELVSDAYKKAVEEKKLDVLGYPDIEEIQFGRGKPMQFAATVETAPEFELPEYKGIPIKVEARSVTEEDVERAVEALRQPRASFNKVERPAQTGDIVVVNYTGTTDGRPITEVVPAAKSLAEKKNFWVEIGSNSFLPGFADQLQGAKAGEKRTVMVEFPTGVVTPELAGKRGVFDVEVVEIKERVLPVVDETFAKNYGAENLQKLREGVRRDLENELKHKKEQSSRNQLLSSLLNRLNFELPETVLNQETRNVVYDIVQENARRGVGRDKIEEQKDQIYTAAAQSAKERVKLKFILQKIAEKQDIKVSEEEIAHRIQTLAKLYDIPPAKLLDDLKKRNALIEIYDQIMNEKVLEYLQQNANVLEVPAGTPLS